MRRVLLLASTWALAIVMFAPPARAITNGVVDETNRYPIVGLVVEEVDGEVGPACSGVLVAPKIFVTAGHCTYNAVNYWHATRVWVSFEWNFDENDPLAGTVVEAASLHWYPGYVPPSAAYGGSPKHDVGIVVLSKRVRAHAYAQLPELGLLGEMDEAALQAQVFTSVGYGCRLGWPEPSGPMPWAIVACPFDRTIGTHAFSALTQDWLKISENYPSSGSSGGAPGDSGAPVFLGDTLVLAGTMFDGGDVSGTGQVNVMRFDEASNQAFIASFLG